MTIHILEYMSAVKLEMPSHDIVTVTIISETTRKPLYKIYMYSDDYRFSTCTMSGSDLGVDTLPRFETSGLKLYYTDANSGEDKELLFVINLNDVYSIDRTFIQKFGERARRNNNIIIKASMDTRGNILNPRVF